MRTLLIISFVIPIILASIAGVMAIQDAGRAPRQKRMIRVFQAVISWYFVIISALALLATLRVPIGDELLFFLRSGLFSRLGLSLLLIWLILDLWSCRKNYKDKPTEADDVATRDH